MRQDGLEPKLYNFETYTKRNESSLRTGIFGSPLRSAQHSVAIDNGRSQRQNKIGANLSSASSN